VENAELEKPVSALPFRSATAVALAERKNRTMLFEWINGNGKLTETENVIFDVSYQILKLPNSCGILTDEHNSYVFLKWNAEIRLRSWKPGIIYQESYMWRLLDALWFIGKAKAVKMSL